MCIKHFFEAQEYTLKNIILFLLLSEVGSVEGNSLWKLSASLWKLKFSHVSPKIFTHAHIWLKELGLNIGYLSAERVSLRFLLRTAGHKGQRPNRGKVTL